MNKKINTDVFFDMFDINDIVELLKKWSKENKIDKILKLNDLLRQNPEVLKQVKTLLPKTLGGLNESN
jgi:hypothetical protein